MAAMRIDCRLLSESTPASEELWLKKGNATSGYIAKIDFLT